MTPAQYRVDFPSLDSWSKFVMSGLVHIWFSPYSEIVFFFNSSISLQSIN